MSESMDIAKHLLLGSTDLTQTHIESMMNHLCSPCMTEADFYLQSIFQEFWLLEDGQVKDGSYHADKGVGIRLVCDEKTGFAYADEISKETLERSVNAVRSIASQGQQKKVDTSLLSNSSAMYLPMDPLKELSTFDKIKLLEQVDRVARAADPRVAQVNASLSGTYEAVLIITQDQNWIADVRPLVRLNVSVIAEQQGRRERGSAGGGGRVGFASLQDNQLAEKFALEATRQALVNLEAIPAPAGTMPVVLGSGWPGILLHEAVGHGLEADFNRKKTSVFSDKMGQKVAAAALTVVDNGTIAERRGSLTVDDEGTPTQNTVLIEKGILKSYMCDKQNGRLLGQTSTGNGRRESYAHIPMPRMTNTYMLAGTHEKEEMIQSVDKGIYAANFGGGQVDITSGQFVFSASEAYLIEKGKITAPIKGATLMGLGSEVLHHVSMIGRDLELDSGVGVCGKDGQSVPVGVGQPTIKVDTLTVGGTEVKA